jgi:methionyl-tRNA formyltransferase
VTWPLVITTGLFYRRSLLASLWKLAVESSLLFCFVRFLELVKHRLSGASMARECRRPGITTIITDDVNSPNMLAKLEALAPDLLVSLYTMHIYRKPVLGIPRFGAITSHPAILPNYRGLEVFFWAMANDEKTTGVSVFTLDTRIDAGLVIRDEVLPISPEQSMADVYRMITECAGRLLVLAIGDIDNGTATYREPSGPGSYYPMPTREAVRRFRRLGKRFF